MAGSKTREGAKEPAVTIADLPALSLAELRDQWRSFDRSDAPVRISREVLVQAIAYRMPDSRQYEINHAHSALALKSAPVAGTGLLFRLTAPAIS